LTPFPVRIGGFRWHAAAALACLLCASETLAANWQGKPVHDVLDALRAEGLVFIYNTELVADSLLVTEEPRAQAGVALAQEILAPHDLALSEVAPKTFAVVRAPASARAQPASPSRPPRPPAAVSPVEEVIVQTSRYVLATPTDEVGSHAFLDQRQVQNLPRLGDETLSATHRLPGVATNGFSGLGQIRGGGADETAIVLDGLRLYQPFHLKSFLQPTSLLDSRLIAGMDVYAGGFPANYGNRMGSIIDARTVQPPQRQYYELGLSLFYANLLASQTFSDGRGHALIAARRSNLGDLSRLAENDFVRPQYADGFARLDYAISDSTRLAFNALLAHDRVEARTDSDTQRANVEAGNAYYWLTLEHDWRLDLRSRLILSGTEVSDERTGVVDNPSQRSARIVDNRRFQVAGLQLDNEWQAGAAVHRFGAELRQLWADYDYSLDLRLQPDFPFAGSPGSTRQRRVKLSPQGAELSAYWDSRWQLGPAWTAQLGLRVDTQTYDHSGDAEQWSPRLAVRYDVAADTRLRASWGLFYQSQGIDELQVEDGVQRFSPAQRAEHRIVSLEHSFDATFDLRLEAYQKRYTRVSPHFENMFDPLVLLPEVEFDRVKVAPDSARAEGVELLLNWRPSPAWSGWFSYTWSRVQDRIDSHDVYRSWDQRQAISAGLAWTHGPWSATLANVYHTGWPTTELELSSVPTPGQAPLIVGPRNAARYQPFNSLDLRVTRVFILPRGQLEAFVEVTNALSRDNPCCTDYSLSRDAEGNPVLTREVSNWLPLVPSVGVLWRYGKD